MLSCDMFTDGIGICGLSVVVTSPLPSSSVDSVLGICRRATSLGGRIVLTDDSIGPTLNKGGIQYTKIYPFEYDSVLGTGPDSSDEVKQNAALICLGKTAIESPQNAPFIRMAAYHHKTVAVVIDEEDAQTLGRKVHADHIGPGGDSNDAHVHGGIFLSTDRALRRQLAAKALAALSSIDSESAMWISRPATVLVVGGGGREHAIAMHLSKSPKVGSVVVAPGNGGMEGSGDGKITTLPCTVDVPSKVSALAKSISADLAVVGPEVPLIAGVSDAIQTAGIYCFGPSKAASKLEESKAWSKDFMHRNNIPTAAYKTFTDASEAMAHIKTVDYDVVVKASGVAAGKGVLMPTDKPEALMAVKSIMMDKAFGSAGDEIVIEECLQGEEVSMLCFCDGRIAVAMPPAQDHKRALDGDKGPNTGGMGAYAPAPCLTHRVQRECEEICTTVVRKMASEGAPFVGVLFAGFMLTEKGPKVLEFNVRMGDPETQAVLPLLSSDLFEIALSAAKGNLSASSVCFYPDLTAAAVVVAATGYPGTYPKGLPISGIGLAENEEGVSVYHSGTKALHDGSIVSNGGRVLTVVGVSSSLPKAIKAAYSGVDHIKMDKHARSDIGKKALHRKLRIGIIGSGNGTSVTGMLQAGSNGFIPALPGVRVVMVVSNRSKSGILVKAQNAGVRHAFVSQKGKLSEEFDAEISDLMHAEAVDLIILSGFMRILTPSFCCAWYKRCLNVHPSLLPAFKGLMDLEVHKAVLRHGVKETGCTIHLVSPDVDEGRTIVQRKVTVAEGETPESLKAKVQAQEELAFIDAIKTYLPGKGGHGAENGLTYAAAGVNIDAGNKFIEMISPSCKATRRAGCDADLGGFGGLFDLSAAGYDKGDTVIIGATDGVGTKLKLAQSTGDHSGVGIDLVAMCVNDLLVVGGEPLFFLDYYASGKLLVDEAAEVVKSIAEGCLRSGCGLIGGETAEMPGMYAPGDYDLAGFAVGAVNKSLILPRQLSAGDVIIALPSSGVHSNGFSLVRKILERAGIPLQSPPPFSSPHPTLAKALLAPTHIYAKALKPVLKQGLAKALAHITGGGLPENLPRAFGKNSPLAADLLAWNLPPIFKWLQKAGDVSLPEMLRAFNCGVGMCIIVDMNDANAVMSMLGDSAWMLGTMQKRQEGQPEVVIPSNMI